MERYGRATEGSQSDPSPEWTAPEPEIGLEKSMRQLGLGGAESYPERPDEADCIYYLRTGFCGYGSRCRFNHPRDRGTVIGAARPGGEYPERVGQPVCQYYMRTGTCKFGASCKYHHPRQGGESTPVQLNYHGYPLRLGEKECSYYVKTGQCKFGATCKFHHPQPAGIQVSTASLAPPLAAMPTPTFNPGVHSSSVPPSQQYGVVVARPPLLPGSYVQSPYGHVLLPSMVPFPGWSPYPAPISPVPSPNSQPTVGSGQIYGMTPMYPGTPTYTGTYKSFPSSVGPSSSSQKEYSFPERPGQPECQHYMRTGDCKYGSSCRYHHPPELVASKTNSSVGLPLRPGAPPCLHYAQRGVCKFGPACKYDHSLGTLSYSSSASSLSDMQVAPYTVGSSIGTLAPSSSSSELRPELTSGSSKDPVSSRMSSSMSASSGSVGSTFSKSEPIPHLTIEQSAQGSGPSTGSSSGGTGARSSN